MSTDQPGTDRALWNALAAPFPADEVESLPKQLQKDDRAKANCRQARQGVCVDDKPCGGYHARSIHLDYIGHAGVTMRLNSVDPMWTWEPMALTAAGTPLATDGGMWIRLTVLGVTRLGFGDAAGKSGPNAVKETIGDAIRNAAMRFGVGTYLWSKSEAAQVIKAGGDPDADAAPPQRQQAPQREPWSQPATPPPVDGPPPGVDPATGEDHRPDGDTGADQDPAVLAAQAKASQAQEFANRAITRRTLPTLKAVYDEARTAGVLTVVVTVRGESLPLAAAITLRKQELTEAAEQTDPEAGAA